MMENGERQGLACMLIATLSSALWVNPTTHCPYISLGSISGHLALYDKAILITNWLFYGQVLGMGHLLTNQKLRNRLQGQGNVFF